MRFSGTISAKLDVKGRVFFPSAYRRLLSAGDTDFVLKRDVYQRCLVIYPRESWEVEVECLSRRLNRWDSRHAMLFRQFLADAEPLGLDAAGRFLIPKRMLEFSGITRELLFVGVDDRVEMWAAPQMQEAFLDTEGYSRLMAEVMTGEPGDHLLQ